MNIPVPIQKGRSTSRDQGTHSFLALPAELRNAVYEYALVSAEDVVVVEVQGLEVPRIWNMGSDAEGARFEPDHSSDSVVHNIRLSSALLGTCRQIYSESASVLYGRNVFTISMPYKGRYSDYRQIRAATLWLRSIGSQIGLITRTDIEVSFM